MKLSARNTLLAAAGLLMLGYGVRMIRQRYATRTDDFDSAGEAPQLSSGQENQPRFQDAPRAAHDDEHLHVTLGEFLNGRQLKVGA